MFEHGTIRYVDSGVDHLMDQRASRIHAIGMVLKAHAISIPHGPINVKFSASYFEHLSAEFPTFALVSLDRILSQLSGVPVRGRVVNCLFPCQRYRHGEAVSLIIFVGKLTAQSILGHFRIAVSQLILAGKNCSSAEADATTIGHSPEQSLIKLVFCSIHYEISYDILRITGRIYRVPSM